MEIPASSSFSSSLVWKLGDFPSSDQRCNTSHIADDILLEILVLLPLSSIFKFKCVSKLWCSLLSDPYFNSKWIKFHTSDKSIPWALFYEIRLLKKTHDEDWSRFSIKSSVDTTALGVNSEVISTRNGLSLKFLIPQLHQKDDQFHVMDSSNGLVLLAPTLGNQARYIVCNPLTQQWVSLPPLIQAVVPCGTISALVYECSPSACYKVVRIAKDGTNMGKFSIDVFCSDKNVWTIHEVSCPEDVTWSLSRYNEIMIHNGDLLWIGTKNKIVAYNLNKNQFRLIDLPDENVPGDFRCINLSEGLICYARVRYIKHNYSLSAWVLKESWQLLQQDIQLNDLFVKEMKSLSFSGALCFDPLDKDVVIIGIRNTIWACNTQTRKIQKLGERHNSFPCEKGTIIQDLISQPIGLQLWPTSLPAPNLLENHII